MDLNISKIKELRSLIEYINTSEFRKSLANNTFTTEELKELEQLDLVIQKHYLKSDKIENRIESFIEILMQFAQHDYSTECSLDSENDLINSMAIAINLLGEELNYSTVTTYYLNDIFNSMKDMLITIDKQGYIQSVNQSCYEVLNFEEGELDKKKISTIMEQKIVFANFGNNTSPDQIYNLISKDNVHIPAVLGISPFVRGDEKETGYVIIAKDMTEIKHKQDIIYDKNKQLENYLYITNHDLRTPLVNIQGYGSRLMKQANSLKQILSQSQLEETVQQSIDKITSEDIPKTLNYILGNVTKMDTLLNGLLHISRTGKVSLIIRKVNMNQMFDAIVFAHHYLIHQLDVEINIQDLPDCYGDENLLNQVFSNIIGNALKYKNTSRKLKIEVTAETRQNKVIYAIKDNGIGIAERHLSKIWNIFFRVDAASPQSGEGIGLSFVKRIVHKHKGKIWATSEEGQGSTFFVELQQKDFREDEFTRNLQ